MCAGDVETGPPCWRGLCLGATSIALEINSCDKKNKYLTKNVFDKIFDKNVTEKINIFGFLEAKHVSTTMFHVHPNKETMFKLQHLFSHSGGHLMAVSISNPRPCYVKGNQSAFCQWRFLKLSWSI